MMLTKTFGPKKEEAAGAVREFHSVLGGECGSHEGEEKRVRCLRVT